MLLCRFFSSCLFARFCDAFSFLVRANGLEEGETRFGAAGETMVIEREGGRERERERERETERERERQRQRQRERKKEREREKERERRERERERER